MPTQILIVEDNPSEALLAELALERADVTCELSVAENGVAAQEVLIGGLMPDLILLDLNMSVMDGREFLGWIKHEERFKHIPVVVLTTSADDFDIQDAWAKHCSAYVRKPLTMVALVEAFTRLSAFYFVVAHLPSGKGCSAA